MRALPTLAGALVPFVACCWCAKPIFADGGTLRASQQRGPYQIAVFTDPTSLRVGAVDVSVWVQDSELGQLQEDCEIVVDATHSANHRTITAVATQELATNKLMRAAQLEIPSPGTWRFDVKVRRKDSKATLPPVTVSFDTYVSERLPRWRELAGWIFWPVVPIGLFGMHLALSMRSNRTGRRPDLEDKDV
jgi:hypothetical protein